MVRNKRGSDAASLGDILHRYISQRGAQNRAAEHMVPAIWAEVVGTWYARHTRVVRVWEGIVEVQCDSAAHAQQLQLDSAEIVRRLNARIGQQYVQQIRPSTAQRPGRSRAAMVWPSAAAELPAPSPDELESIELTAEDERRIEECANEILDDAARQAFVRAARTHLKLRKWKRAHGWLECPVCGELYPPGMKCICERTA